MDIHSTSQTPRPAGTPAARLARSVVCAALIAGLAWIGAVGTGDGTASDPPVSEAAAEGVAMRGDHAAAHRRQVFEQRRARFDARTPTKLAGGPYHEHPAP